MKNYILNHKAGERAFALSGLIAVAASVMAIYTVTYSSPASAKYATCMPRISSEYKKHKHQSTAKQKARVNWRWKVRARGGVGSFNNWDNADHRVYSCKKSGNKWACLARATPCLPL